MERIKNDEELLLLFFGQADINVIFFFSPGERGSGAVLKCMSKHKGGGARD